MQHDPKYWPIRELCRDRWRASQAMHVGLAAALALVCLCQLGCHPIDRYDTLLEQPVPPALEPPRELAMMSLPAYQIEPPDVLQVELLKLVPLPPYRLETYDVLQIVVVGTLLDQPIEGGYLVESNGTINLGPAYGSVRVLGMTVDEAEQVITEHLEQILKRPEVSVQLGRASGMQPVTGTYLVAPDGTINLRQYGMVHVAGKTLREAKRAIDAHLAQFLDSPDASVDVASYNSKVYYIITEGAEQGDNIVRVPITGNETVLDAISQIQGLSQLSSKEIWIARPSPAGFGCEQVLPVDWDAITRGGMTATNYQVLPGDRVFVAEDPHLALSNYISKVTAPIERALGVAGLGVSTIRNFQSLGRSSSSNRGF
jgi:polysaccharide export outer membrane protein